MSSYLLRTTKKEMAKEKTVGGQRNSKNNPLFLVCCVHLSRLLSLRICSVEFGVWLFVKIWVSVLYLHNLYPINCFVYRGAWRGEGGGYA